MPGAGELLAVPTEPPLGGHTGQDPPPFSIALPTSPRAELGGGGGQGLHCDRNRFPMTETRLKQEVVVQKRMILTQRIILFF